VTVNAQTQHCLRVAPCASVSITIWDSMVSSTAFHRFVFRVD
jgi:hypothetical protein